MNAPNRRHLLAALGTSAILPIANAQVQPRPDLAFFTAAEAAFIGAAADRLIPEDDFASASQAGVVTYIDRQLAGPFGKGERMYLAPPHAQGTPEQGYQLGMSPAQVYRESLQAISSQPPGRDFGTRTAAQQDAFLKELEAGVWMLGRVPSAIFFETLLANVIEGYFADPIHGGNRDMVGWRMIGFPGAYAHYTQWVGRHNVRFNRPPVAIASQASAGRHTHDASADPRVPESARPRTLQGTGR